MKSIGLIVLISCALSSETWAEAVPANDALPLSTKSTKVLGLVDLAWKLDSDQVEQDKAIAVMSKVVKLDPNFAMGHEILAQISLDPAEQSSSREELSRQASTPARPSKSLSTGSKMPPITS